MGRSQGKKAHAVLSSYISQDVPIWLRWIHMTSSLLPATKRIHTHAGASITVLVSFVQPPYKVALTCSILEVRKLRLRNLTNWTHQEALKFRSF